jgi:hypothetical protein
VNGSSGVPKAECEQICVAPPGPPPSGGKTIDLVTFEEGDKTMPLLSKDAKQFASRRCDSKEHTVYQYNYTSLATLQPYTRERHMQTLDTLGHNIRCSRRYQT